MSRYRCGSSAPTSRRPTPASPPSRTRTAIRLGEELVIRGAITGGRGEESITLKEDGKDVGRVIVPAKGQGRFVARHRPKAKGQHVYTLELAGNDAVPQNNTARFTVQVVQEKINVLLIEGFPASSSSSSSRCWKSIRW